MLHLSDHPDHSPIPHSEIAPTHGAALWRPMVDGLQHAARVEAVGAALQPIVAVAFLRALTNRTRLRDVARDGIPMKGFAPPAIGDARERRAWRNKIAHTLHPILPIENPPDRTIVAESLRHRAALVQRRGAERRRQDLS